MGSATPSIESYYNALTGKFGLVELQHKYHQTSPTQVKLINIHKESEETMQGLFSESLLQAMEACIKARKQVILFQNRKGYVPMLECNVCGWVSKCVNCDIALTYYKYSNNLRCHYCGYQQGNISKCSACGNHSMEIQGYGTERITEELQLLKPEWRVMRFDQDSTRQKNAYRQLLNEFESGAFDVMVGTQMAVKGLDYGKVGLTAVLNVDHLMNIPDYRSNERVFQLLTQLAGRAGRTFSDGQLLVQTKQVNHPLLAFVHQCEYKAFYQQQIVEREQFHYAPFSRLIKLTLKHASAQDIQKSTALFAQLLKQQLGDSVLGPETPYVSKLRNQYLRNILVKYDANKSPKGIKPFILKTFDFMIKQHQIKGLQLHIDVDC
jgi:primosomal protein N' (replication factor Y)